MLPWETEAMWEIRKIYLMEKKYDPLRKKMGRKGRQE